MNDRNRQLHGVLDHGVMSWRLASKVAALGSERSPEAVAYEHVLLTPDGIAVRTSRSADTASRRRRTPLGESLPAVPPDAGDELSLLMLEPLLIEGRLRTSVRRSLFFADNSAIKCGTVRGQLGVHYRTPVMTRHAPLAMPELAAVLRAADARSLLARCRSTSLVRRLDEVIFSAFRNASAAEVYRGLLEHLGVGPGDESDATAADALVVRALLDHDRPAAPMLTDPYQAAAELCGAAAQSQPVAGRLRVVSSVCAVWVFEGGLGQVVWRMNRSHMRSRPLAADAAGVVIVAFATAAALLDVDTSRSELRTTLEPHARSACENPRGGRRALAAGIAALEPLRARKPRLVDDAIGVLRHALRLLGDE
jgi:hypothetical protein